MRLVLLLLSIFLSFAVSYRHGNTIEGIRGIGRMRPLKHRIIAAYKLTSPRLKNPSVYSTNPLLFPLANSLISSSADSLSAVLLNSTLYLNDKKYGHDLLDHTSPFSIFAAFEEDSITLSNYEIPSSPSKAIEMLLMYALAGAITAASSQFIDDKKDSSSVPSSSVRDAGVKLATAALAVFLRGYGASKLGMASSLYFAQPLPLLLRLSADDLTSFSRLGRMGSLLGGALLGKFLLENSELQLHRLTGQVLLRKVLSAIGWRGAVKGIRMLWKLRRPIMKVWRRRNKRSVPRSLLSQALTPSSKDTRGAMKFMRRKVTKSKSSLMSFE